MLKRPDIPLTPTAAPAPPVERLVIGRPVAEAAEMLPRIFNLCRSAQEVVARLCFDLPLPEGWRAHLAGDIARDHALKLAVMLPARLGQTPLPLPQNAAGYPQALWGAEDGLSSAEGFERFLRGGHGIAPAMQAVDQLFGRDASCDPLPSVNMTTMAQIAPLENSVAARHLDHPVMQHVAQTRGRGPVWRLLARALDLATALANRLPDPVIVGQAVRVPAARGLYTVEAAQQDGRVAAFRRVTPTDHLLAPGGVMAQSLARLPRDKHGLAPLLVEILDPCRPVTVTGGAPHA